MRKLIVVLILIAQALTVFSQSAAGRYSSRMVKDGTIYFIMPHKLNQLLGIKHFDYDMTLLSWSDSVTVNFTFESKEMFAPKDLCIKSAGKVYRPTAYSPLFIDIKKNHYEIRITSKFLLSEFESIVNSATPPVFWFKQGGEAKSAAYSSGAWKKDRKKLNDIIKIYHYSK